MFSLGDDDRTFTAADVLLGKKAAGKKTAVIGGGLVGCELALWLKDNGTDVTIIEAMPKILSLNAPLCHANSEMLEKLIPYKGIQVLANTKAKSYRDGTLELESGEKLQCDSVILAVGYKENNQLYEELADTVSELYLLGDARKVSNIMYAIWDAFEVASSI